MKRLRFILALACVALSVICRAEPPENGGLNYFSLDAEGRKLLGTVEKHHLYKGLAQLKTSDPRSAVAEFDFILQYFPNHPVALSSMVDVTVTRLKRPDIARDYLDRALALDPTASSSLVAEGIYFARLGRLDEAIRRYERALALEPSSMNAHYNLGLALLDAKSFASANAHAQAAYRLGHPLPGLKQRLVKAGAWDTKADVPPGTLPAGP